MEIRSVPNQKIILNPIHIIQNKQNEIKIDINILKECLLKLKTLGGIKLFFYLYSQPCNKSFPLSRSHFMEESGLSKTAYDNGIKELIEKGFLIKTTKKNFYIFNTSFINNNIIDLNFENEKHKKNSLGENKIKQLLLINNDNFIQEAQFDSCLSKESNYPLRFDFFVNDTYLIEYNGEQHYKYNSFFFKNEKEFKNLLDRDNTKIEWCKKNKIPLIIIPNVEPSKIKIEDLQLEKTSFRIC